MEDYDLIEPDHTGVPVNDEAESVEAGIEHLATQDEVREASSDARSEGDEA